MLQRAKPCFDNEVAAILARLRRSRIVCSDETSVRIDGHTHWNWVFQNEQVVIHVVRNSRAAAGDPTRPAVAADFSGGERRQWRLLARGAWSFCPRALSPSRSRSLRAVPACIGRDGLQAACGGAALWRTHHPRSHGGRTASIPQVFRNRRCRPFSYRAPETCGRGSPAGFPQLLGQSVGALTASMPPRISAALASLRTARSILCWVSVS